MIAVAAIALIALLLIGGSVLAMVLAEAQVAHHEAVAPALYAQAHLDA